MGGEVRGGGHKTGLLDGVCLTSAAFCNKTNTCACSAVVSN